MIVVSDAVGWARIAALHALPLDGRTRQQERSPGPDGRDEHRVQLDVTTGGDRRYDQASSWSTWHGFCSGSRWGQAWGWRPQQSSTPNWADSRCMESKVLRWPFIAAVVLPLAGG